MNYLMNSVVQQWSQNKYYKESFMLWIEKCNQISSETGLNRLAKNWSELKRLLGKEEQYFVLLISMEACGWFEVDQKQSKRWVKKFIENRMEELKKEGIKKVPPLNFRWLFTFRSGSIIFLEKVWGGVKGLMDLNEEEWATYQENWRRQAFDKIIQENKNNPIHFNGFREQVELIWSKESDPQWWIENERWNFLVGDEEIVVKIAQTLDKKQVQEWKQNTLKLKQTFKYNVEIIEKLDRLNTLLRVELERKVLKNELDKAGQKVNKNNGNEIKQNKLKRL